jgi:hypothetical protein
MVPQELREISQDMAARFAQQIELLTQLSRKKGRTNQVDLKRQVRQSHLRTKLYRYRICRIFGKESKDVTVNFCRASKDDYFRL